MAYLTATRDGAFLPARSEDRDRLLGAFETDKAFYELNYELNNRPEWVRIPLLGILAILEADADRGGTV